VHGQISEKLNGLVGESGKGSFTGDASAATVIGVAAYPTSHKNI
jgi:hypothetical protein